MSLEIRWMSKPISDKAMRVLHTSKNSAYTRLFHGCQALFKKTIKPHYLYVTQLENNLYVSLHNTQ